MKGIFGKILKIDLSNQSVTELDVEEEVYKKFLGGYGLGVWYIYRNLKPGIDPLGAENILGFIPGMFNGVNVPMAGRMMASTKSPLTGTWGDSNVGGFIGPELKRTGYDGIFIHGLSKDPVYIHIEKEIEILDASNLWGKSALETENFLRSKYIGSQVLSIGKPGENLSLISSIMTDRGRALGRSGVGAVMGSKKLKAIVAKGTKNVKIHDIDKLRKISNEMLEKMNPNKNKNAQWWHKYGTIGGNEFSHLSGDTPIKNWKGIGIIDFGKDKADAISGEKVIKDNVKSYGCAQCPVACGAIIKRETRYGIVEGHRLEYEGGGMLGGLLLNGDLDSIVYGFELANRYGYDVISLGEVIAFSMELFENGKIKREDIGFELRWGDGDAVIKMIEFLNRNEGIAKILNQGVMRASEYFNAEEFAIHVHGQELPAHDPKYLPSLATTYVADPTPGRHTAGGIGFSEGSKIKPLFNINYEFPKLEKYSYVGKGKAHAIISNQTQVENALGFCIFSSTFSPLPYVDILNALTGWNMTNDDLLKIGERIQNLRNFFNLREGLKPGEFKLPDRARGMPPHQEGPLKGITLDVDSLVKEYYNAMEWDIKTGMPSKRKIEDLGLDEYIF
ncbi:MAG: aldehyde ferredoxin oxidoreductase family protein [Thermoplasmata archaeon]|nr:aldehyde ferredoxin oxidoreductase family protein [Thermoplasmata archaeon]